MCSINYELQFLLLLFFFGVPHLATCIFFMWNLNQDWVQVSILTWLLLNHFHLVLDEIQTHDLPIMSLVCLPLDQAFALNSYFFINSSFRKFKKSKQVNPTNPTINSKMNPTIIRLQFVNTMESVTQITSEKCKPLSGENKYLKSFILMSYSKNILY